MEKVAVQTDAGARATGAARAIRVLPPEVASQIAAGEVVDRPASVVKELVENALDASATRIVVTIEGGGADLLRVADDGEGIAAEELPLAVTAHATSKVRSAVDLERVETFGFRGEALASVASVSRMRIVSRARGARDGAAIEVESGEARGVVPAASPEGTLIEVRQLFAPVPARRKFLKSARTEAARCADALELLALSHPGVSFELQSDGKVLVQLSATTHVRTRVLDILGRGGEHALEVEAAGSVQDPDSLDDHAIALWGLVGRPDAARPAGNEQRIAVNGRPIRDRAILSALREAYRGLVEPGRLPPVALFLTMPPQLVDVNVHPAKTEVRFRHPSAIWKLVRDGVRAALAQAKLVPSGSSLLGTNTAAEIAEARHQSQSATLHHSPSARFAPVSAPMSGPEAAPPPAPASASAPALLLSGPGAVLQVDRTWLVLEESGAIVVVDQHALHERVMFEKLKERVGQGALASQRLLLPDVIAVGAAAMLRLESLESVLTRIGFDIAPAGPRSIAVSAVPAFLLERGVEPTPFLRALLEAPALEGEKSDEEAVLASILDMMACKAAVKGGDRLTPAEAGELLAMRDRVERSTNCPHGRPTSVRIPLEDIERRFGRR